MYHYVHDNIKHAKHNATLVDENALIIMS